MQFSREAEFAADLSAAARAVLDEPGMLLFRLHYAGGLEWRDCGRRLGLVEKGRFFHAAYAVEELVGCELVRRRLDAVSYWYGVRAEGPSIEMQDFRIGRWILPARQRWNLGYFKRRAGQPFPVW